MRVGGEGEGEGGTGMKQERGKKSRQARVIPPPLSPSGS